MPPSRTKPRPSDVAADTKRNFIPMVKAQYGEIFPPFSWLYRQPSNLPIQRKTTSVQPPQFIFEAADPVTRAITYGHAESQTSEGAGGPRIRLPFICAANERRPGGDWETACSGYEERLCRRSNLSATLATPWPESGLGSYYPLPSDGVILSEHVVVCRGAHDRYEKLDSWFDLPVVSVPPTRWPKLKEFGTKYSFSQERDMIKDQIRGALRICLYNNYDRVVIGDFGLGNNHRNPPQEMAEMWRDIFLFDPEIRGQFAYVIFAFDDPHQSTSQLILSELLKKELRSSDGGGGGGGSSSGRSKHASSSSSSSASSAETISYLQHQLTVCPTDMNIFLATFDSDEITRVLSQPDPRYALGMITT